MEQQVGSEHLYLSEGGLPAKVSLIESMGSETRVLLEEAGTEKIVLMLRDRTRLHPGQTARVAAQVEELHFFDKATGTAIR